MLHNDMIELPMQWRHLHWELTMSDKAWWWECSNQFKIWNIISGQNTANRPPTPEGRATKKQGLCQGNASTPSACQMLTFLLVNVQRSMGNDIHIRSPISQKSIKQVKIVYVDSTNLWAGLEDNDDLLSKRWLNLYDLFGSFPSTWRVRPEISLPINI